MATQENSVQFSLSELTRIEEKRRNAEEEAQRAKAEAEARAQAEEAARLRRLAVQAEAQRAAEAAAAEARLIAEARLAEERRAIAALPVEAPAPVVATRPAQSRLGIAAIFLSVLGLSVSLGYAATQRQVPGVSVVNQPISLHKTEPRLVPSEETAPSAALVEESTKGTTKGGAKGGTKGTTKGGDKTGDKGGAVTATGKKDCGNDPLCGLDLGGVEGSVGKKGGKR